MYDKHLIAVTGPESTGKTTLCKDLARSTGGIYVPEFARDYIENLNRQYTFRDVEIIAKEQVIHREEYFARGRGLVFFDTDLIITKLWFEEVFNNVPGWLDSEIKKGRMQLYLLCSTEPPWIADNVRENGGRKREYLFKRYEQELKNYDFPYFVVSGMGDQRLVNALDALKDILLKP